MTLLMETDDAFVATLRSAAGEDTQVLGSVVQLRHAMAAAAHAVVVLGPSVQEQSALELAAELRVTHPAAGVILVRHRIDSAILRQAMRAGIREVITAGEPAALSEACQRSREVSSAVASAMGTPEDSATRVGQLVTVFAVKGGCGKTMLATNLAVALAGSARKVCLVDVDLSFGDVAISLQLEPVRSIADAVGLTRLDAKAVHSLVTAHSSGLHVIAAPQHPGGADGVHGTVLRDLLAVLKQVYDVVVVDCPAAFTDSVLACLDVSDQVVLLTTLDVPAVKNLKLALQTLDLLGYERDKLRVVLNRSDARVGLSASDVEKSVGATISAQVPSSRAVPTCTNRGVAIVTEQPAHAVSVAIRKFADQITWPLEHPVAGSALAGPRLGLRFLKRAAVTG